MSVAEEKKGNRKTGNKAKANPTRDWAPLTHISYYGTQTEQCLYAIYLCMNVCMGILISVCILQHITVCVYVYLYRALAYILLLLVLFGQRALYVVYTVRLTNWPTGETKFRFIFMQRRGQWKLSEVGSFLCVYFILSFAKPFNNNSNSNRH